MKIYNVVVVYDCYVLAESEDEAKKSLAANIRLETEPASEQTAIETREERNVRASWRDKKPMVADDVSDDDFEKARGKTTIEIFHQLHTRPAKVAAKK